MRILVCKTFGLGNAVQAIPMLKALTSLGHMVDVLVGTTPDDAGALEVMRLAARRDIIENVWADVLPYPEYDLAVCAIPYDGRWKNGVHFDAKRVMDGRTRPDPDDHRFGYHTWKKHEAEYQLDNAIELGYRGPTPGAQFAPGSDYFRSAGVYLGMGYKKAPGDPWARKHWGNESYAQLAARLAVDGWRPYTTTNILDLHTTVLPVARRAEEIAGRPVLEYAVLGLEASFAKVSEAALFVGNDTGMMHVAASFGVPVVAMYFMEGARVKSAPWMTRHVALEAPSAAELPLERVLGAIDEVTG